VRRRVIVTPALEGAFRRVPREAFFLAPYATATHVLATDFEESEDPCRLYTDTSVVLDRRKHIHSAAPSVAAKQLEQLALGEGMRALHVGTGTGYYTAIMAELVGERGSVVGVEYEEKLAKLSAAFLARAGYTNVTVQQGDGAFGVPEAAPFDRILTSGGTADIVPAWIVQLDDDGRLVLPLCPAGPLQSSVSGGVILTIHKVDQKLSGHIAGRAFFMPLAGAFAPTKEEGAALADGLIRWFALEEFLGTDLPIRIALKSSLPRVPDASSVPWLLETPNAILWVEPN
jgi:protein-L-isoaspartate(D-aspartate) O-methyltransferase